MSDIQYRRISHPEDQAFDQVKSLFSDMYIFMQEHGLLLSLAEHGQEKWIQTVKRTVQRFSTVQIASIGDQVIGFAHGALSMTPDYLVNKKIGVVTHIYVMPEYRKQDIAAKLLSGLEEWFDEQQVHSIELQVLAENTGAIEFWKQMGYKKELHQFRKLNQ